MKASVLLDPSHLLSEIQAAVVNRTYADELRDQLAASNGEGWDAVAEGAFRDVLGLWKADGALAALTSDAWNASLSRQLLAFIVNTDGTAPLGRGRRLFWGSVVSWFDDNIVKPVAAVVNTVVTYATVAINEVGKVINSVADAVDTMITRGAEVINFVTKSIDSAAASAWSAANTVFQGVASATQFVGDVISKGIQGAISAAGAAGNALLALGEQALNGIIGFALDCGEFLGIPRQSTIDRMRAEIEADGPTFTFGTKACDETGLYERKYKEMQGWGGDAFKASICVCAMVKCADPFAFAQPYCANSCQRMACPKSTFMARTRGWWKRTEWTTNDCTDCPRPQNVPPSVILESNATYGAGNSAKSLGMTWYTPIRPQFGWVWGPPARRPSWQCAEAFGNARWSTTRNETLPLEPFPRCAIPRAHGFVHSQWARQQTIYSYRLAPGFVYRGGDLTRECNYTSETGRDWSGRDLTATCAGIAGTHSCSLWMSGNRSAFPTRGPAPWELRGQWAQFVYSNIAGWPQNMTADGYRLALMTGMRPYASIRGERIDLSIAPGQTAMSKGVIVLNGTHASTGTPVWFYLTARFPANYYLPEYRSRAMPLLGRDAFDSHWTRGLDAYGAAVRAANFTPSFAFSNMVSTSDFVFEMRWRGGPAPVGDAAADGAGHTGLYEFVNSTLGWAAAENMDVGVEFAWAAPKCVKGTFQSGDECSACPARTFVDRDAALLAIDPKVPHPCRPCGQCDWECEQCSPTSGFCMLQDGKCKISNVCKNYYDTPWDGRVTTANDQCRRCLAKPGDSLSAARWTVNVNGTCNDFQQCSFNDQCSADGFCVGTPDDCLRKSRTGTDHEDCEVCGAERCAMALLPNGQPKGCVVTAPVVSYAKVSVNHTYCLHPATGEYGMWDSECAGSNYTYGRSTEEVWEPQFAPGARKQCGCRIGGACFAHGSRHPNNTCSVCDVVRSPNAWSLLPSACNDGSMCTYDDKCVAVQALDPVTSLPFTRHTCVGTPYVCPRDTGQSIQATLMTCSRRSDCDGAGGCLTVPKPQGSVCYNISDRDVCMPVSLCDGLNPSCPAVTRTVPVVNPGALALVVIDSDKNETDPERYTLQSAVTPAAQRGTPYVDQLPVAALGWTASCGWIEFAAGYYTVPDDSSGQCDARKAVIRPRPGPGGAGGNRSSVMLVPFDNAAYPVKDGSLVQLVVRSRNADGVELDVCFPGAIVVDASKPIAGRVTNVHPDFPDSDLPPSFHYGATLAFSAAGFSEEQSQSTWGGQLKYEYMVAAYPVDPSKASYWAVPATLVGFATTVFTPVVADATRYVVFVRAYNRAGLASAWARGADVTIDRLPPRAIGSVTDLGYAASQQLPLSLSWTGAFAPAASALSHFEVGWGTQRGNDNTLRFRRVASNATSLTVPFTGQWANGTMYFGTVRAVSLSGTNVSLTGAGQKIDYTPPTGLVVVGPLTTTVPLRFVTVADMLSLSLSYSEPESFLRAAEVNVSSRGIPSSGSVPVDLYAGVLPVSTTDGVDVPLPAARLTHAQTIFACVRVQNAAFLWSSVYCQNFTVDKQVPSVPFVYAIAAGQTYRNASTRAVSQRGCMDVQWAACANSVSGIDRYELRITSNANGTGSRMQVPFVPGPDARAGPGAAEAAPWRSYALALTASVCPAGNETYAAGVSYYFSVRCVAGSGLVANATSPSVVFDFTPPTLIAAGFGTNALNPQRFFGGSWVNGEPDVRHDLNISWVLADGESAITEVWWAVGTCNADYTSEEDVAPYTLVRQSDVPEGDLRTATRPAPRLLLQGRSSYCVNLRVTNAAGLSTSFLSASRRLAEHSAEAVEAAASGPRSLQSMVSAGSSRQTSIITDFTPPALSATTPIRDGFNRSRLEDAAFAGSCATVAASWSDAFVDPDSPMTSYQWCVSSGRPGSSLADAPACDVLPWTRTVATTASATINASALPLHGRTVFASVRGFNDGGLWVQGSSNGVTYDCLPPASGSAQVLGGRLYPLRSHDVDLPFVRPPGYMSRLAWVPSLTALRLRTSGFTTALAPLASVSFTVATEAPVSSNATGGNSSSWFASLRTASCRALRGNGYIDVNPFQNVIARDSGRTFDLGTYSGLNTAQDLSCPSGRRVVSQSFVNGEMCGVGLPRRTIVTLGCRAARGLSATTLVFDSEPTLCVYLLTLYVDCAENSFAPGTLCAPNATFERVALAVPSNVTTPTAAVHHIELVPASAWPASVFLGASNILTVTATHAGGLSTTVTADVAFALDHTPPVIGLVNVILPLPDAQTLPLCFDNVGDAQSGIGAAFLTVHAVGPAGSVAVPMGSGVSSPGLDTSPGELRFRELFGSRFLQSPGQYLPSVVELLSVPRRDIVPRVCINATVARMPASTPLRATLTLVNNAGLAFNASSPLFFTRPSAPEMRSVVIPPQALQQTSVFSFLLQWTPARDVHVPCCTYRIVAATRNNLSEAVELSSPAMMDASTSILGGLGSLDTNVTVNTTDGAGVTFLRSRISLHNLALRNAPLACPLTIGCRLYIWLRAYNSLGASVTVAANRPLALQPSDFGVGFKDQVVLRSGDAPLGEIDRGHQVVLTDNSTVTLLYNPGPPNPNDAIVGMEAQLWEEWFGWRAISPWVPLGPDRRVVFRNPSGKVFARTTMARVVGKVRLTFGTGRQASYDSPHSFPVPAAGEERFTVGRLAVLGGGPAVPNDLGGYSFTTATFINGETNSFVVAFTGVPDIINLDTVRNNGLAVEVALGRKPFGEDVMAYSSVPASRLREVNGFQSIWVQGSIPQGIVLPGVVATVRFVDRFGFATYVVSSPFTLVTQPPAAFSVWNTETRTNAPLVASQVEQGWSCTWWYIGCVWNVWDRWRFATSWEMPSNMSAAAALQVNSTLIPSGFDRWQWAVSTVPYDTGDSGTLVAPWSTSNDVTLRSGGSVRDGALTSGDTVYMLVRLWSRAGLTRTVASPPIVLNPIHPLAQSLTHPLSIARTDSVTVSWYFESLRSGRDLTYWVSAGTSARAVDDLLPVVNVGSLMSFTFTNLLGRLNASTTSVFFSVLGCDALNRCNRITSAATSGGGKGPMFVVSGRPSGASVAITTLDPSVNRSAPLTRMADVLAASPQTAVWTTGDSFVVAFERFNISWPAVISRYAVVVGDGPGLGSFGRCEPNITNAAAPVMWCRVTLTSEPSHQTRLWASVTAFASSDVATTVVARAPVLIDRTESTDFEVAILNPLVPPPYRNITGVAITMATDIESGVSGYEYSLRAGSLSGPVVVNWILASALNASQVTTIGSQVFVRALLAIPANVSLPPGALFVGMRAVNGVNLTRPVWADAPVYVDPTPPMITGAVVADGPDPIEDAAFITARSAVDGFAPLNPEQQRALNYSGGLVSNQTIDVWVSWAGFSEPESWIDFFLVGLGTSASAPNVAPMRRTTGSSSHVFPAVPAVAGSRLFAFVQAVNIVGLASNASVSNGAELDLFAPELSPWVASAKQASLRLQASATLRNLSAYAYVFTPLAYETSGDQVTIDSARPLMTVGLDFTVPAAVANGGSCTLSSWPFQVAVARAATAAVVDAVFTNVTRTAATGAGAIVATVCAPGAYRTPFGPCLPCAPGEYKPAAGEHACSSCPADTIDSLAVTGALTLFTKRAVVSTNVSGATSCRCLDDTQVFSHSLRKCVCAPGYVPSASQQDTLEAWRGNGEVLEDMCVRVTGRSFKTEAGDAVALVRSCPNGTSPNGNASSCVCPRGDLEFDAIALRCACSAGRFATGPGTNGSALPECGQCPDGTFKVGAGNPASLCTPCPFGTTHNRTRSGCEVNQTSLPGGAVAPGSNVAACPPGTQYNATGVFWNARGRWNFTQPRCEACPAGQVQPLFVPVTSVMPPANASSRCGVCPGLLEGSYFASAIPDLFLDWSGVFSDGRGSGIAYFEVAVGSVVGGSQIVPFTRYSPNVTEAVFRNVQFNPGLPLFLTVVAVDRAGNGASFEDVRPVFIDTSAPLAGLVLDGSLDGYTRSQAALTNPAIAQRSLMTAGRSALNYLVNESESSKDAGRITSLFELVNTTRARMLGAAASHLILTDSELDHLSQSAPAGASSSVASGVSAHGGRRLQTVEGLTTASAFRWSFGGSVSAQPVGASGTVPYPISLTTGGFSQAGAAWTAQPQWIDGFTASFRFDANPVAVTPSSSPRPFGNSLSYVNSCPNVRERLGSWDGLKSDTINVWDGRTTSFGDAKTFVYVLDLGDNPPIGRIMKVDTCNRPGFSPLQSRLYVGEGCPTTASWNDFRQVGDNSGSCGQTCVLWSCTNNGAQVSWEVRQRYYFIVVAGANWAATGGFNMRWYIDGGAPASSTPSPSVGPAALGQLGEGLVFALQADISAPTSVLGTGGDGLGYIGISGNSWGVRFDARDGATLRSTLGFVSGGRFTAAAGEMPVPACMMWHRQGGILATVEYTTATRALLLTVWAGEDGTCRFTNTSTVNLPALMGCASGTVGCRAHAGFLASTGTSTRSEYRLSSFSWANTVPSPSTTATSSLTASATSTASSTATASVTPSGTLTPTATPTSSLTSTVTPTGSLTSSRTGTATSSKTAGASNSQTASSSATASQTASSTKTASQTASSSRTSRNTGSATNTASNTASSSQTASETPPRSLTATRSFTPSNPGTKSATPTRTGTPTRFSPSGTPPASPSVSPGAWAVVGSAAFNSSSAAAPFPVILTPASASLTGAAWFTVPQSVMEWSVKTVFEIQAPSPVQTGVVNGVPQLTWPLGHGLAIVLHRDGNGTSALGGGGGSLGAAGISRLLAARFDSRGTNNAPVTSFGLESSATFSAQAGGVPSTVFEQFGRQTAGRGYMAQLTYSYTSRTVAVSMYPLSVSEWRSRGSNLEEWLPGALFSPTAAQTFTLTSVDLVTLLGCAADSVAPVRCSATFGVTAATGSGFEYSAHILHGFRYLNAQASGTPSNTPTTSQTPSITPTGTITPSPTASAAAQDQLAEIAADRLSLDCAGNANNCSVSLNLCRSAVTNVKQPYSVFALGRTHGCAIDARGDARCFGNNTWGQAPQMPIPGPFRHIAVTDRCTCGMRNNGTVRCWGATRTTLGCPASAPGTYRHFAMSASGYLLLLRTDYSVDCVGDNRAPGCAAQYSGDNVYITVAAAGPASCAIVDPLGIDGDGSTGGDAHCFGLPDVAIRPGPFGSIVGVGPNTFCGLFAFSPVNNRAGQVDCWGTGAAALLRNRTTALDTAMRALGGSYHDPVSYGVVRSSGYTASFDGAYDNSRGCAGAPCACNPDALQCRRRSSAVAPEYPMAQPYANTGLASATKMTCGVTCSFGVTCFGPDAANPVRGFIPGWLSTPCAVAVPMDVGAPLSAQSQRCNFPESGLASFQRLARRDASACNVRGWWNNGTLFIDQQGGLVSLWPQAPRFGSYSYAPFVDGEQAVLSSGGGNLGTAGGLTVRDLENPRITKLSGSFSDDCTRLVLSDGARWDVVRRCAVRYVRISRGAALSPELSALFPGAPAGSPGQPGLFLSGVEVYDIDGALISPGAQLTASSTGPACSGAGAACLAAAVDLNATSAFATLPAWAPAGSASVTDPFGWLQLDFGREVYVSRIVVRSVTAAGNALSTSLAAANATLTAQAVFDAMLLGVTVEAFDDQSYMPFAPPATTADNMGSAFRVSVVQSGDLAANPNRFEWRELHRLCGFDPRASASPSPTASRTATASVSVTPSRTTSGTASGTVAPSGTPTRTGTASNSGTRSSTPSGTPSGTPPASASATRSASPSASPSMIADDWEGVYRITEAEAAAIGAGESSTGLAPYDWRTDTTLLSLADAPELDFQAFTDSASLAWEPFEDVGSGVAKVAFCLGRAQFVCNLFPWTTVPSVKTHVDYAVVTGLNLTAGTVVFATVAAVNNVGLVSMTSSDGVYADDRAPFIPRVYDTGKYFLHPEAAPGAGMVLYRPPVDLNCDVPGLGVGAAWRGTVSYAGIQEFAWAVGTAPNATDILDWTPLGEAVAVYNSTLTVPAGVTYFTSVRATGKNGKVSYSSSDGVLVINDSDASDVMTCLAPLSRANVTAPSDETAIVLRPRVLTYVAESAAA